MSKDPEDMETLEEIEAWEKANNDSNDIYRLSARVKNLAVIEGKASLTPVGAMLCNTYTHVLKALYDFSETIQDKAVKDRLVEILRNSESMPAKFILASKPRK